MFYSHEVLTSRKYGIATVWLVATLGAKSNLKKVNRKAILNVDVPKACQTIIDPAAPMALRLQGNLLLGVSRVYLQQCGYVLSDAQHAQSSMRMMLKTVKNAGLDPDAGKARPEQLVLQDDPSFLPDFALPPLELLTELNLPLQAPISGGSQSLTPFGSQQAPGTPGGQFGGLILPSSSSRDMGEFRIEGDIGPDTVGHATGLLEEDLLEPLAEPVFGFDADGNFFDNDIVPVTPVAPGGATMSTDARVSARVRQEHEERQYGGAKLLGDPMDLDLPIFGDDLPEGEAFPAPAQPLVDEYLQLMDSSSTIDGAVAAPMQSRKRTRRALPTDLNMELRNKDLAEWNVNYLQNMEDASRTKNNHRATVQAKKNAEFWVWGAGIGGIGHRLLGATSPMPLSQFYGENLFDLVIGSSHKQLAGTKHDRDSGIDETTQGESRRVRRKFEGKEETQIVRGQEDEGFLPGDDGIRLADADEVEFPRDAPTALDDQQVFSAMPWNMSASVRGSSAVPQSSRAAILGSAGVLSLSGRHGSSHLHRGSRMISESPLRGRGQASGLETLKNFKGEDEFSALGAVDFGIGPGPSSDGVWANPADAPKPSVRVREALSTEGENFLGFIYNAITEKRTCIRAELNDMSDLLQADVAGDIDEVLFEEVLPPAENSKMVAAQGLLMVLSLSTRGMLNAHQDICFGEIRLSLPENMKEMQPAKGVDEGLLEREGQLEEQQAAGSAQAEGGDDDNGSLYDL